MLLNTSWFVCTFSSDVVNLPVRRYFSFSGNMSLSYITSSFSLISLSDNYILWFVSKCSVCLFSLLNV